VFDASEMELDDLVTALEDLQGAALSVSEAIRAASAISGQQKHEWLKPIARRIDHRGNPLELYLPKIPVRYDIAEPVVSLGGWILHERHDYSILFTQDGARVLFDMALWDSVKIPECGLPLMVSWDFGAKDGMKSAVFDIRREKPAGGIYRD
jgi:hypothetical protein